MNSRDIYDPWLQCGEGPYYSHTGPFARTEGSHTHLWQQCKAFGVEPPQKGTKDYDLAVLITQTFTRVQSHFTLQQGTPYVLHPQLPQFACFATLHTKKDK